MDSKISVGEGLGSNGWFVRLMLADLKVEIERVREVCGGSRVIAMWGHASCG